MLSKRGVHHYCDAIMGAMASQITSLTIVYSTVHSGTDQRKHQSSAPLHGLCVGNSPVTSEFLAQMASNAKNASIWWRQHDGMWILVRLTLLRGWLLVGLLVGRWRCVTHRLRHAVRWGWHHDGCVGVLVVSHEGGVRFVMHNCGGGGGGGHDWKQGHHNNWLWTYENAYWGIWTQRAGDSE